jgi:D-glycero-D-manno-heptose 1,7-bisphosphate phosphatase
VFVITNQAIINRGMVSREVVDAVNRWMVKEIERCGGRVSAVAYCPHRSDERCACRKPQPGLILGLARGHGLDLHEAVVIGDALTDLEAGATAGCETILVLTGRGREQLAMATADGLHGFLVADDLRQATELILRNPTGVG